METSNTDSELIQLKRQLTEQYEIVKKDIEAIDRVIELRKKSKMGQIALGISISNSARRRKIGPVKAVRKVFNEFPNNNWYPAEIRDKLKEYKKSGILESDAKDLLSSVHTELRKLVKNNIIIKDKSGEKPTYKKK